ncbi:MAG: hypothetical protein Q8P41_15175 [Pseudomonadota bacterium]|nr:hypothetical protein [Pseudomonadota bacterium]
MLLLLACAGAPSDDTASTDDTGGGAPLPPAVLYLSGDSQYYDSDGVARGRPTSELLRRTVTPEDASLEERVIEKSGGAAEEYLLLGVIDPDGPTWTYSFTTADGTLEGSGTFDEGETWAWTAWHSTSTFVDGDYAGWTIESEDRLDGDTFTASKAFHDATGAGQGTVEETLAVIDAETWEETAAEW